MIVWIIERGGLEGQERTKSPVWKEERLELERKQGLLRLVDGIRLIGCGAKRSCAVASKPPGLQLPWIGLL